MKPTEPLRRRLESAARRYHDDNENVPITFVSDGPPRVDMDGNVSIDPEIFERLPLDVDKPMEYAMLRCSTAHEVMHINRSVLTGKADMAAAYPGLGKLAGAVFNILEDRYVDHWVYEEHPGLRATYAYEKEIQMDSDEMREPMGELMDADPWGIEARLEGLTQICLAGYVKGYNDARRDVREFLDRTKARIDGIVDMHDPGDREALMHDVMEDLAAAIPENAKDRAEKLADMIDALSDALGRVPADAIGGGGGVAPETPDDRGGDSPGDMNPQSPDDALGESDDESGGENADSGQDDVVRMSAEELGELGDLDTDDAVERGMDIIIEDRLEPSGDRDERAIQAILDEIADNQSDYRQRLTERDERMNNGSWGKAGQSEHHEKVKKLAEERGIVKTVREAFDDIATSDGEALAETGYRVDIDQVVARASGNLDITELHREEEITESGDRAVAVALDTSGSMSATAMKHAKLAIAALAIACEKIGDDFLATGFTIESGNRSNPDNYELTVVNGPDESFEWQHLDAIGSDGAEPVYAGVNDARNLLNRCSKRNKLLFVITDGKATVGRPGSSGFGRGPVDDARESVNAARTAGISVVGLGIGNISRNDLGNTFGTNSYVATGINRLADDLIAEYERTLETVR